MTTWDKPLKQGTLFPPPLFFVYSLLFILFPINNQIREKHFNGQSVQGEAYRVLQRQDWQGYSSCQEMRRSTLPTPSIQQLECPCRLHNWFEHVPSSLHWRIQVRSLSLLARSRMSPPLFLFPNLLFWLITYGGSLNMYTILKARYWITWTRRRRPRKTWQR